MPLEKIFYKNRGGPHSKLSKLISDYNRFASVIDLIDNDMEIYTPSQVALF